MSGHSKWSTIKNKKEKTDSQRAKIFTKIGREISVAVKIGGPDLATNSRLRDVVYKAKSNNVPSSNIERIIKKASGEGDKNDYINIVYEGYGPQGVAVLVKTLTDNKNRTAANVRHYFDKFGGKLGSTGCVAYLFEKKGVIFIKLGEKKEDDVFEFCTQNLALDCEFEDDMAQILVSADNFYNFLEKLKEKGYEVIKAEIEEVPSTYVKMEGEENRIKMEKLIDAFREDDDVLDVWTNCEEF